MFQPDKFVGYSGNGEIMVLVCHMILQDHVTKESRNYMGGSCSR